MALKQGDYGCLCRVQNMLSNAHGVHRGSSWPRCSRRPKHILRAVSLCGNAQISVSKIDQWKFGDFYDTTAELKGFHRRNSFAHGTRIRTPPPPPGPEKLCQSLSYISYMFTYTYIYFNRSKYLKSHDRPACYLDSMYPVTREDRI